MVSISFKKATHYTDLKIPVDNFYRALKGDLTALWIGKQGKKDLSEAWKNIYEQYCEVAEIDTREAKQAAKINVMIYKYNIIQNLIEVLKKGEDQNIIDAVKVLNSKKYGYKIDLLKPLKPQVDSLERSQKSFLTRIKIEENKLPKETEEDKKELVNIMDAVIAIENSKPGITIDVYTMPMIKWVARMKAFDQEMKLKKAQAEKQKMR
ncbi:hypothetical protein [Salinimicrobium sp. GXAS 041]|uniref:hypothetical protein n=1 Tax=Salinimicrobium sp. GXAS 041 TaxID=3400806 RepID=UPI003C73180D